MKRNMALCAAAITAVGAAGVARGQYLMVPDSTNDVIVLLNASDGSVVNPTFIADDNGVTFNFSTPKDVQQVGNEIWVADQVADAIFCFSASLTPSYIRTISGGMNNIRGMGQVGSTVFVANSQAGNGATGPSAVMFTLDGTPAGSFVTPDPFDCTEFNGKVLVTDIDGYDLLVYNVDGSFDSTFHASDGVSGIDFPQQVIVENTGAAGAQEVWCAGFTSPSGIYRYDAAGAQVGYWSVGASRGVAMLGNGQVLFTSNNSVLTFDPAVGTATPIHTAGAMQFIGRLTLGGGPTCDSIDFNNDGLFPDTQDIDDFLSVFSGGTCSNDPSCGDIDYNNDGLFPDTLDIDALLSVFSGGPCLV